MQASGEHQVCHLADLAGIAVLQRQYAYVAAAGLHLMVCLRKIPAGYRLALREDALCRDIRERAFHPAVGSPDALHQPPLVSA